MITLINKRLADKSAQVKYCFCIFILGFMGSLALAAEDPVSLFEAGKLEEAKQAFLKVLDKDRDDAVAMYYLGRLEKDGVLSRRYFARLLQVHPTHALADDALLEIAEAAYAHPSGTYLTARKTYRQLLNQFPKSPHVAMAQYRIGLTFLAVRQPDSAVVAFNAALEMNHQEVGPQARLGKLEALAMRDEKTLAVQQAQVWLVEGAGDVEDEVRSFIERFSTDALPPVEEEGKFWVRVGVFGNASNVAALKKKLEDAKFKVSLVKPVGSRLTKVLAGPYVERQEADENRKRISDLTGQACTIEEK